MTTGIMVGIDALAIFILTIPLYYRRHRRRDLVTAYTVLNVGVFAVASILGSLEVGIGVGMGLFGVLSIIRLRSTEISQYEVAYYFSSLSIGLIAGLGGASPISSSLLILFVLAVVALVDAKGVLPASRQQEMRIDHAFTDEGELRQYVEGLLNARITNMRVISVDLVNDTTYVDVRWVQSKTSPTKSSSTTERIGR